MAVEMTLAEKVLAVMRAEDFRNPVDSGCDALPAGLPAGLGEFEMNLRDWGMYYGIAVGLARTEEPCEPIDSVASRAVEAAKEAFTQLNGEQAFAGRQRPGPLVDAVLAAYHADDRSALDDALITLGNTLGWPSRSIKTAA